MTYSVAVNLKAGSLVTKIVDHGDSATHLDITFVASGFTTANMNDFHTYVSQNVAMLQSVNWFATNWSLINIWRVDAVSSAVGTDLTNSEILFYAAKTPYDICNGGNCIAIIHQDPNYNNGQESAEALGVHLLPSSGGYVVLAHEFGHQIAGLCDEYYTSGNCVGSAKFCPNVHDQANNDKWLNLVTTPPKLGARYCSGGQYPLWRPSDNTIMNQFYVGYPNYSDFDAVGSYALDMEVGKILGTVETTPPQTIQVFGVNTTNSGTVYVTSSSASSDVERVEYYWAKAGTTQPSRTLLISRTSPYTLPINTTLYVDGDYNLDVVYYDTHWNYARKTVKFTIYNAAFSIPLRMRELCGITRYNEVVSCGVPLDMGRAATTSVFAVYNDTGTIIPAQFKILERWCGVDEDNSIKWMLVTFFVSTALGGQTTTYTLGYGSNRTPDSPVTVDTSNSNYITMGGQNYMRDGSGPYDISLIDGNGNYYHASDLNWPANPLLWTVEETGPLRACIKVESDNAGYEGTVGYSKFGFIAWYWAYAGTDRVDAKIVLKNSPRRTSTPRNGWPFYFKSFSVTWPRTGTNYTFGGEAPNLPAVQTPTVYSGTLASGESAYIYQDGNGSSAYQQMTTNGASSYGAYVMEGSGDPWPWQAGIPSFQGFQVVQQGLLKYSGNHACGFASLNGSYMLVRDFWKQYPVSFDVSESAITAQLPSGHWTCSAYSYNHWLDDCQRKSWDISFRPTGGQATDSATWDYPLMIYCGQAWYKTTNVIGYISPHYVESTTPTPSNSGNNTWASSWEVGWTHYGGLWRDKNRMRWHHLKLFEFARTGDPYWAHNVLIAMRHSSSITPMWIDSYAYDPVDATLANVHEYMSVWRLTGGNTGTWKASYVAPSWHHNYMPTNREHSVLAELYDGYRLTGDPLALDAINKIAVSWMHLADYRKTNLQGTCGEARQDGDPVYNLCEAYRLTENSSYMSSIVDWVSNINRMMLHPTYHYYKLHGPDWDGVINYANGLYDSYYEGPMMIGKVCDGQMNAYDLLQDPTVRSYARDTVLKLIKFCIDWGYSNWTSIYHIQWDVNNPPGADYYTVLTWVNAQSKGNGNAQYGSPPKGYGTYTDDQSIRAYAWCSYNGDDVAPYDKASYYNTFFGLVEGLIATNMFAYPGYTVRDYFYYDDWGPICDQRYENP